MSVGAARPRLLLVDGDPLVCRAMSRVLQGRYAIAWAMDGEDAIDRLHAASFDLVIIDAMREPGHGAAVYRAAITLSPGYARRFLFVTAGVTTPTADEFMSTVAAFVLEKPFGAAELEHKVAAMLDEHR